MTEKENRRRTDAEDGVHVGTRGEGRGLLVAHATQLHSIVAMHLLFDL